MALNQIWKQQLTLVTYGNEYLRQNLSFTQWRQHHIFDQHSFQFRDLISQHLLAQHFQVWLEALKKQGTTQISLHLSTILNEEQNPNSNVELLPYAHFIVSHQNNKKIAWIFGHELAEWYSSDNEFEPPLNQRSDLRLETFWRFELNEKLSKKVEADLKAPQWDEIADFMETELFRNKYAAGFEEPEFQKKNFDGSTHQISIDHQPTLALIPENYPADCAHQLLYRTQALSEYLEQKKRSANDPLGEDLDQEQIINLRNFTHKTDDLFAKLIVKAANHYQTAQLKPVEKPSPFDATNEAATHLKAPHHKAGGTGVIKLIVLTVIICALAYYFGL
ncbi:hypothetical protein [Acinetobacter nosocomialis]|uniref:hypothetical protein n=1 Tax=Acinetobacter nosocomialis TaxID=106654 RepID=UPI00125F9F94|nr:hypothetical protein [Acinetobacter nosocomialis]MCE5996249.1 hypothetical protein [Acinetobacter nosocomialis]MCH2008369.1 hypothetical protein [Acinetobacter nosocomialis]HBM1865823.1 hypothetical protein [Acinetobacter nosocomialis]HCT3320768.1 hypothetical protein [Acinetobacter nosocomialis]